MSNSVALRMGRLVDGLMLPTRWDRRRYLVYVASINAMLGLLGVALYAPMISGDDIGEIRRSALTLANGQTGWPSPYPPITALAARPLTWLSPSAATILVMAISVALVLVGVALETRGHHRVDRVLVAIAAVSFGPVVYEILLGQTTLLLATALYPAVRRDGYWNGVPLGVALALAPKPMLLPVLAWMLVWRRRALLASLVTAAALTGGAVVLTGWDRYAEWTAAAAGLGHTALSGDFAHANFSLWAQGVSPLSLVIGAAIAGATGWAIVRDPTRGFVAALFASLLLAPYTLIYAASIMLLAVRPMLVFAPRATRLLAFVASLAVLYMTLLAPWSLVGLIVCLPLGQLRTAVRGITRRPIAA